MVDILEDFKPFLEKWCNENHLPKPEINNMNRVWLRAWHAYTNTYLKEHYEEVKQQYLDIPVLTKTEYKKQLREEKQAKTQEKQTSLTSWERVQKIMNE